MLTDAFKVGERISAGPATAWFRNQLWVAYAALDGKLIVRSVDVRHNPAFTVRRDTGFVAGDTVAIAVWSGRLYILYGTAGVSYQLTSTQNGISFTPPRTLPLSSGFVGPAGLTGYSGGLAILWAENAGGRAHLLRTTNSGASYSDVGLPFSVMPEPALIANPSADEFILAYGDRLAGPGSFNVAAVQTSSPSVILRSNRTLTPELSGNVAICPTRYHNRSGIHFAVEDRSLHGSGGFQGRSAFVELAAIGGEEPFVSAAIQLSLTFDGVRAWVAWRAKDSDVDHLFVAPYMYAFELPGELRALIGQACDPNHCPVDPRLVCAATDDIVWINVPPVVQNAFRGDLVLTPGDGAGLIGTMLEQLEPRQANDHMGIMIRDHDLVRHATMAHDRTQRADPGHYMTGEFFYEKAPVNGFRWDALMYGWPGTITQSVEDAFFTGFNTIDPATGRRYNSHSDYLALNPTVTPLPQPADGAAADVWEAWFLQQYFADPEFPADKPFRIQNLPSGSAYRMDTGQIIEPVVVKPDPAVEASDSRIRATLHRVADAAETISGHYRFYSYTNAAIAFDPAKFGPPLGDPLWEGKPASAAWCAGNRPLVCSSFIWTAVQIANAKSPTIELEGRAIESPEELLATPFVDGLYRYTTDERIAAAKALHQLVAEKVRSTVYFELQKAEHEGRLVIDLTTIGITGILTLLAGPVAAAAFLLGVTPETITSLKILLEDMPDDVATQLCNAFSHDRADETDDHLWESPGEGVAVSPDDIKNFWDPFDRSPNSEWWHGLYGNSEKLLLSPRRWEPRRVHQYDRSPGPAFVQGRVTYRGVPIEGARVRFGCESTMTTRIRDVEVTHDPMYQLDLSAGLYEAMACAYWPSTQELLSGRRVVKVQPGDQPDLIDIELEDPPEWRRLVRLTGRIDIVRRVLIGTDDWAHTSINQFSHMTKAPDDFGPPPAGATFDHWSSAVVSDFAQRFNVRVDFSVELRDDLSIVVNARSALCQHYYDHSRPPNGDEVVTAKSNGPQIVPPGGSIQLTFDHDSGNFPPDRGHVELKFENLRVPA